MFTFLQLFRAKSCFAVAVASLSLVASLGADVVELKDGRSFEGTVLSHDDDEVRIDAVVATIRAKLTFTAAEVESVVKSELPADFYTPSPSDAAREDRSKFAKDATLYLEVPIVGEVGEAVLADGVRRSLAYAKQNGVEHIVFRVDSDGGSLDEALAIVRDIRRFEHGLTTHALVLRCHGDALAVPTICDTVSVTADSVIGGSGKPMAEGAESLSDDLEKTLRSDLARRAAEVSNSKGRPGTFIRAMIDPDEELAVWRDEEGDIQTGQSVPEGIATDKVLFQVGLDEVLSLDGAKLKALGAPLVSPNAAELGADLGYEKWTSIGDYGQRAMQRAAENVKRLASLETLHAERKQAKSESDISRNIERRVSADRTLQNSLRQAAEWDPTKHDYATYQKRYKWWDSNGYGSRKKYTTTRDTNRFTKESRQEWQQRTDTTMSYLSKAARAARSLQKLDKEAVELGLDRTYQPGELGTIIQDLENQWNYLSTNRDKKGR